MKDVLSKINTLVIHSTADPEKFSLTLKSVVSFLFLFYGWGSVDKDALEGAVGELGLVLAGAVALGSQVFTAIYALYGAFRKIVNIVRHGTA